jgi:hypothetical protein
MFRIRANFNGNCLRTKPRLQSVGDALMVTQRQLSGWPVDMLRVRPDKIMRLSQRPLRILIN